MNVEGYLNDVAARQTAKLRTGYMIHYAGGGGARVAGEFTLTGEQREEASRQLFASSDYRNRRPSCARFLNDGTELWWQRAADGVWDLVGLIRSRAKK